MRKLLTLLSLLLAGTVAVQAARADSCSTLAGNLVSNCGFETGSFSGYTGTTTTSDPQYNGVDGSNPYQGNYSAYLASLGSATTLSQMLNTIAGDMYTIKFELSNDTASSTGYSNSFSALFGGASLFSTSNAAISDYTLYTLTGTANSNQTLLSFMSRNDVGYFSLDNLSVVDVSSTPPTSVTPEPSSWLLLATGMAAVLFMMRRYRVA